MSRFKSASKKRFDEIRKRLQSEEASTQQEEEKEDFKFFPKLLKEQGRTIYTVRFLPNVHVNEGQDEPWVEARAHMFYPKGAEKKTYQLCPTNRDDKAPCPICERAKELFSKQNEASDRAAKAIYKKRRYFANVLIVKDPRKGEESQEGKVLIWEFGKKVFDKLTSAMTINGLYFWDVDDGANFNVVITKDGGYNNYDSSDFDRNNSSLEEQGYDTDELYDKIHNIHEKVLPDSRYRTYDELNDILNGKSVVDNNTKDETLKADEDRKTRTRDSETEEVEEKNEPAADVDKAFEDETTEEEVSEPDTAIEEDEIDISNIDFDADDLI